MAKSPERPAPAPPTAASGSSEENLNINEVLSAYETQIGTLTGQLIQRDLVIKSLRQELVSKATNAAPAPPQG